MNELAALLKQVLPHTKFRTTAGQPGGMACTYTTGSARLRRSRLKLSPDCAADNRHNLQSQIPTCRLSVGSRAFRWPRFGISLVRSTDSLRTSPPNGGHHASCEPGLGALRVFCSAGPLSFGRPSPPL